MSERAIQYPKRNYSTAFRIATHFILVAILVCLLAWFFMVLWFIGIIFIKNGEFAREIAVTLADAVFKFIAKYHLGYGVKIAHIVRTIEESVLPWVDSLLHLFCIWLDKVNFAISVSTQKNILTTAQVIILTTEVVLARVLLFTLSLPMLISLLFVLAVDGLGQRDIRKFQGARESTFFFHRVKPLTSKLFFIALFIFLALPVAINPQFLLIPVMIAISLFAMYAIKGYKKYA